MIVLPVHQRLGLTDPDAAFNYLASTMSDAIRQWDYFVNWDAVFRNTRQLEMQLNLWNYLLGKQNFAEEFRQLLSEHPDLVSAIPSLIVRNGAHSQVFDVLTSPVDASPEITRFDFSVPADTPERIEQALVFVQNSGLEQIFRPEGVKNLIDYIIGVEAGIGSNGRKNRGGTAMETIISQSLQEITDAIPEANFIDQATPNKIKDHYGITLDTGDGKRRFDFALWTGSRLILIETNLYGVGGSKLKATAGEYTSLQQKLRSTECTLVWVTDGQGWTGTLGPLKDAFMAIDHIFNLHLLAKGALLEMVRDSTGQRATSISSPQQIYTRRPSQYQTDMAAE